MYAEVCAGISEQFGLAGSTQAPTGIMAWFLSASTAKTSLLFMGFKARGNFVGFRGFLRGAIPPGIDFWLGEKREEQEIKTGLGEGWLQNYFLEGTGDERRGTRIRLGHETPPREEQRRALGTGLGSERRPAEAESTVQPGPGRRWRGVRGPGRRRGSSEAGS